jgi:dipeptide/tripeptide permease
MASSWRAQSNEQRGAYTTVAQAEGSGAELTAHGKELENETHLDHDLESAVYVGSKPTPEDFLFLPRVADKLPYGAFLVAIVELCERFAAYGLAGPLQNYMANSYHDANGLPGALGLSQSRATALSNFFQFWCYVTPILGAVVADQYLGRYLTIKYFSIIYMTGIAVLLATSLPWSIERGAAFPGLLAAMVIIGLGTGGIKSNVSPLIAEQVRSTSAFVETRKDGKQVIVDPEITVQRIYMIYYMCINVGSVSAIATTLLELHVGFWSAYLLPLIMFCIGYAVLVRGKDRYIIKPPQGGVIGSCFRALWIAARNGFDIEKAQPSARRRHPHVISWNDSFIDELKTALMACKVFLFFPIYWVAYSQMMNNFVSQGMYVDISPLSSANRLSAAGQMQLHGLPNDILPNIDPITIILLVPIVDRFIYPFIRTRLHLAFTPMTRITVGFFIASAAMLYAGGLQSFIYNAPPCYSHPSNCEAGSIGEGKFKPNEVHVAWQMPAYILIALSEILASITGLELAYAKAPENMKSFIMSLFLLTNAGGSALGILIAPLARDPYLQWLYFGLAIAAATTGYVFYRTFKNVAEDDAARNIERAEEFELMSRGSTDNDEELEPIPKAV